MICTLDVNVPPAFSRTDLHALFSSDWLAGALFKASHFVFEER